MKLKDLEKLSYFTNKEFELFLNKKNTTIYLNRLNKDNKIKKIEKNKYTLNEDVLTYATQIHTPSYLSLLSALNFYNYTTQISIKLNIITKEYKRPLKNIKFIKINKKCFFGYKKVKYKNQDLFIADKEKLLLDCLIYQNHVQISDTFYLLKDKQNLNKEIIIKYLKKINNISLIKRAGYLLEQVNIDIYNNFKKEINNNNNYIKLNKNLKKSNKNNSKWKININEVIEL